MSYLMTALAAFFTILLIRKLPGIRGLVERGVKRFECEVCMSAWTCLFYSLDRVAEKLSLDLLTDLVILRDVAVAAGLCYLILTAHEMVRSRMGWKDNPKPEDFEPPPEEVVS